MESKEQIQNAKNLDEVAGIISKCTKCSLCQTKTKDVPGAGNPNADILFIGEAPGKDEDIKGEPFVGRAGQFLTEMIESIELKREDVYIANVLKHRPPENRDPFPEEVKACEPYLKRQIELIQPKLIVFLGRHAMNEFFPEFRISKVHGKAFRKKSELGTQVFLALYHPAAALYNGGMRETLQEDFAKIPRIIAKLSETKEDGGQDQDWKQEKLF